MTTPRRTAPSGADRANQNPQTDTTEPLPRVGTNAAAARAARPSRCPPLPAQPRASPFTPPHPTPRPTSAPRTRRPGTTPRSSTPPSSTRSSRPPSSTPPSSSRPRRGRAVPPVPRPRAGSPRRLRRAAGRPDAAQAVRLAPGDERRRGGRHPRGLGTGWRPAHCPTVTTPPPAGVARRPPTRATTRPSRTPRRATRTGRPSRRRSSRPSSPSRSRGHGGGAQGSGVINDDKGHILTNNHVVAGASDGTCRSR